MLTYSKTALHTRLHVRLALACQPDGPKGPADILCDTKTFPPVNYCGRATVPNKQNKDSRTKRTCSANKIKKQNILFTHIEKRFLRDKSKVEVLDPGLGGFLEE